MHFSSTSLYFVRALYFHLYVSNFHLIIREFLPICVIRVHFVSTLNPKYGALYFHHKNIFSFLSRLLLFIYLVHLSSTFSLSRVHFVSTFFTFLVHFPSTFFTFPVHFSSTFFLSRCTFLPPFLSQCTFLPPLLLSKCTFLPPFLFLGAPFFHLLLSQCTFLPPFLLLGALFFHLFSFQSAPFFTFSLS